MNTEARPSPRDVVLNPYTIQALRGLPPQHFHGVRIDAIFNCNIRCVYCHTPRSQERIELDALENFLRRNVLGADVIQLGCGMEPTLDPRMTDVLSLMGRFAWKPGRHFVLQTNATLLHKHDPEKILRSGVTRLSVSVDSANPETHKRLRGGGSLSGVIVNITNFQRACPGVDVAFVTTLTKANIHEVESMVALGLLLGVRGFNMREALYSPESGVVDHSKMPALLLEDGDFERTRKRLLLMFGDRAHFQFLDRGMLNIIESKMNSDSLMRRP